MVGLLAAVMGFLLYSNTFGHQWCLDDYSSIKENWIVKSGLNWESLKLIFTTEYRYGAWSSPGSLYRPIPLVMFALEWQLSPDNPMIGHVINVLLYAFTGWLLWITWRRVLSNQPPALVALAVLLFMAHPVHTEVVANTKSRDEILSLLFSTAALYALWRHLDTKTTKWLVWSLVFYGLALFSKESAITLLAVFPLAIWFFRDESLEKNLTASALMLIPAVIFLIIRHQILAAQPYPETYSALDTIYLATKDRGEQLTTAFMMSGRYLQTLFVPHPLISDMGFPQVAPVGFDDPRSLLGFAVYAALFGVAMFLFRRKNFLSFAILFYLITFSLFSNVFMIIGTSYGERLLYLPSLGFAFAVAYLLCKIFKINDLTSIWNPNGKSVALWGTAAVLLMLYSFKTFTRNPDWYVSGDLYAADLPNSPNCAKLNYHNGIEVVKKGINEKTSVVNDTAWVMEAIESHTRAIELYPDYHDAYGARGLAWFRLGQYDKAFEDYQVSLKHRPNNAQVLSNLGFIYFLRGQLDDAERVYKESIKYDGRFVDARRNLGAVLAMKKQFTAAIEQWQEGLKYEPNNGTLLFYIGSAYRDMGQMDKAQPWLDRAKAQGVGQ